MKRYAIYARVSTLDQNPDMQLQSLREFATARGLNVVKEYVDKFTGTSNKRKSYQKMWDDVKKRKIDGVLVWKFDRFARSTKELVNALTEFDSYGVDFVSFQENIDTSTAMGKMIYTIMAALSEFEVSVIQERVREGIKRRLQKGLPHGQQPITDDTVKAIIHLHNKGMSMRHIATRLHVSKSTVHNYIKEARENGELSTDK